MMVLVELVHISLLEHESKLGPEEEAEETT